MKSIVYLLFVAVFSSIIVTTFSQSIFDQKQIVKIKSIVNSNSDILNESCSIIKKRLKDYGLQNFDVFLNMNQENIEITFNDKVDVSEIWPLLTSKGKIEFYETYKRLDVIKLMDKGDKLFSILNIPSEDSEIKYSPAVLGYCKPGNISQVDSFLAEHYLSKSGQCIKFLWGKNSNKKGDCYLYLLKCDAALDKSKVLEAVESKTNESTDLMISFNERSTPVWQSLSRNNIDKPIAIVIDNFVYFDPILKNEIKGGQCVISGNFTLKEVIQLKTLINNDELPVEFRLIK